MNIIPIAPISSFRESIYKDMNLNAKDTFMWNFGAHDIGIYYHVWIGTNHKHHS
jgi:hypothetical protein